MIKGITFEPAISSDAAFANMLINGSNVIRPAEERLRRQIVEYPSSVALSGHKSWHIVGIAITTLDDNGVLNLDSLLVDPGHRGKQVGTYLLRHLLKTASRNYSAIQVITKNDRPSDIARTKDFFMRRNGFEQGGVVGDEYEYYKKLTSGKTGN
jgi:GNAT superfamily N-acetyltransferase